jgi:hypothetical protein
MFQHMKTPVTPEWGFTNLRFWTLTSTVEGETLYSAKDIAGSGIVVLLIVGMGRTGPMIMGLCTSKG